MISKTPTPSQLLERLTSSDRRWTPMTDFKIAICHVALGDQEGAFRQFGVATESLIEHAHFWKTTGEPNVLMEAFVLSGGNERWTVVQDLLREYGRSAKGRSLMSQYAVLLAGLVWPRAFDHEAAIINLLHEKSFPIMHAIGVYAQALISGNDLEEPTANLLEYYAAEAEKEFRYDPRRFLCLPLMALLLTQSEYAKEGLRDRDLVSATYLDYVKAQRG